MATKTAVIQPDKSYTFADYFKLNPDIDELLDYFGYNRATRKLRLPQVPVAPKSVAGLQQRIETALPFFDLTSEMARREILIAPVLIELARTTKTRIKIEYQLRVTKQLQGTVDYFIQGRQRLLVVEAKNEDLQRGFTQLAVELIALAEREEQAQPHYYGAISIGTTWQFGVLKSATKTITQDLQLYLVPDDLAALLGILTGILSDE